MRDLVFKNLTSFDGKKKRLASSEVVDQQGVRSVISRHLACIVKEINSNLPAETEPEINLIKERNSRELKERFYCRVKGRVHAIYNGKLYEILYMHSIRIKISSLRLDKEV